MCRILRTFVFGALLLSAIALVSGRSPQVFAASRNIHVQTSRSSSFYHPHHNHARGDNYRQNHQNDYHTCQQDYRQDFHNQGACKAQDSNDHSTGDNHSTDNNHSNSNHHPTGDSH